MYDDYKEVALIGSVVMIVVILAILGLGQKREDDNCFTHCYPYQIVQCGSDLNKTICADQINNRKEK